jgi:hypothetical protein
VSFEEKELVKKKRFDFLAPNSCLNVDFRQSGGCRSDCSGSGILILVVGGHAVARNDVAEADSAKQIGKNFFYWF